MSLLKRIKDVVVADLHQLIDEKEKKNPSAMLNQFLRNCEGEIRKVEGLVKRQTELKSKFFEEKEHAMYMAKKREHQVEIATKAQEADLEKRAQEEAVYFKGQAEKLTELYEKAKKDESELQSQLKEMRSKLKEIYNRRLELMGRENVDPVSASAENGSTTYFSKVEKQIDRLEELMDEEDSHISFDARMAQLERELNLKEDTPIAGGEDKE